MRSDPTTIDRAVKLLTLGEQAARVERWDRLIAATHREGIHGAAYQLALLRLICIHRAEPPRAYRDRVRAALGDLPAAVLGGDFLQ